MFLKKYGENMSAFESKTSGIVITITTQFVSGFKHIHTSLDWIFQFVKCLSWWWVGVIWTRHIKLNSVVSLQSYSDTLSKNNCFLRWPIFSTLTMTFRVCLICLEIIQCQNGIQRNRKKGTVVCKVRMSTMKPKLFCLQLKTN